MAKKACVWKPKGRLWDGLEHSCFCVGYHVIFSFYRSRYYVALSLLRLYLTVCVRGGAHFGALRSPNASRFINCFNA
jgi:hypothetical protein